MTQYFTKEVFLFLKALKRNNNREWFLKNKQRYEEEVKKPILEFISDLGPELKKISPYFKADPKPVGGSLFRIYRDVRFSEDKSPYKTHLGAHFRHRSAGKDVHTPGFYFHIEPGNSFSACGIWHPDSPTLTAIRGYISRNPAKWKKALTKKLPELGGDSLKKAPKGFDPEHIFIEDLKRKDFICSVPFSETQMCSQNFMKTYLSSCKDMSSLMIFLTDALGLSW